MKIKIVIGKRSDVEREINDWLDQEEPIITSTPVTMSNAKDGSKVTTTVIYRDCSEAPVRAQAAHVGSRQYNVRVQGEEMTGYPPDCPVCGVEMLKRHRGSDGAPFWGCSKFPGCRGVVDFADDDKAAEEAMEDNWMKGTKGKPPGKRSEHKEGEPEFADPPPGHSPKFGPDDDDSGGIPF